MFYHQDYNLEKFGRLKNTFRMIKHNKLIRRLEEVFMNCIQNTLYKVLPDSDKRDHNEKLCTLANAVCVFGICLCIGVFANSNVVHAQVKKSFKYHLVDSEQDVVLSFDIRNQFKLFILAIMAAIGSSKKIPWLMVPWLKHTAFQIIQQSVDQFYQLFYQSKISNPYFLISFTLNGVVLRAMWFKILFMFMDEFSSYGKRMSKSLSMESK